MHRPVPTSRPLPLTMLGSPKPSEPGSFSGVVKPACAVPPPTAAAGVAAGTNMRIAASDRAAATRILPSSARKVTQQGDAKQDRVTMIRCMERSGWLSP
jgi:hypothetical protein